MNKDFQKDAWKRNILRIACWNIVSWTTNEHDIHLEMVDHQIDICAISETQRKRKRTIIIVILNTEKGKTHLISFYEADISKRKEKCDVFHEKILNELSLFEWLLVM